MNELMHVEGLRRLAREINAGEEALAAVRGQVAERLTGAAAEIILQGQRLLAARQLVPHGQWYDWLRANCPQVSARSATRYMLRAQRADEALGPAKELRLLLGDGEGSRKEGLGRAAGKGGWLADLEGLNRVARAMSFLAAHPVREWPEASRARLRELLGPVVREVFQEVRV